ncbi:unnamed protein product [Vitrella brassicaformis CCMP3155]|uniref:Uncharacterized protein n=1 Tax=Vitrella brassicaformis (strain CCMP3155) TaxID=1169540 RepID=A0A0G4FSI7_VITBC|nr:unnamed protein product [Vitrella brassicaformis CCMP3155]|eukprot:CEM17624.1 unnamed protein product [Vitrella brassicaformis CCMP3155]
MPLVLTVGQAVDRLWEKKGSLGIRSSRVKTKTTLLGLVESGYESLRKSGFGPYLREHRDEFGGVIKDIPSDDNATEKRQASSKRQLLRRRIVSAFLELQIMLIGLAVCSFTIKAYYNITEANRISAQWLIGPRKNERIIVEKLAGLGIHVRGSSSYHTHNQQPPPPPPDFTAGSDPFAS